MGRFCLKDYESWIGDEACLECALWNRKECGVWKNHKDEFALIQDLRKSWVRPKREEVV